jgi:Protein of unknown function (DUF3137)
VTGTDEQMAERAVAVRKAVEAAGWMYVGDGQPTTGLVQGMGYELTDMCAGLVEGEPVTVFDVVQLMADPTVGGYLTGPRDLGDRQTVAQMGFPSNFRLTVTEATGPGRDSFIRTGPRVELESSEFAERFHVYCDDQVLARMVLNPAAMALLLEPPYAVGLLIRSNLLQLSTPSTLVPPDHLVQFAAVAGKLRLSALSASSHVAY